MSAGENGARLRVQDDRPRACLVFIWKTITVPSESNGRRRASWTPARRSSAWRTIGLEGPGGTRMTTVAVHAHHRVPPAGADSILFETMAEAAFRHYARVWKPGTLAVNRSYLANQILPSFRGRPIAEITRADVQRWFASLHATPAAADRSLPILSAILRHAEIHGQRPEGGNPCLGIRRYRRRGRERFLTLDEYRRLGAALAAREVTAPLPAAAVRLLLRPRRGQSDARSQAQSPSEAHPLPVRRRDRAAARGAECAPGGAVRDGNRLTSFASCC